LDATFFAVAIPIGSSTQVPTIHADASLRVLWKGKRVSFGPGPACPIYSLIEFPIRSIAAIESGLPLIRQDEPAYLNEL
jgi:hypothetical protein